MKEKKETIMVAARVRPPSARLAKGMDENVIDVKEPSSIKVKSGSEFLYDKVFAIDCTQETVFESVGRRIVDGYLEGYNGTIFAYGQTGSGKTYTMLGPAGGQDILGAQAHLRGLIPRAVEYVFRKLDEKNDELGSTFTYSMKCTFAQLYNESFYDLLSEESRRVTVRASTAGTMYLLGAAERYVHSADDISELLNEGLANRRVAETAMNQESSRSHAILTMFLKTTLIEDGIVNVRSSTLNLVDLAGSERQRDAETNSKARVKEACSINGSLLILGRVIRELADPGYKKGTYVPYRDSGLTYLLKDSLGGNARTAFIVTVHPNKRFVEETISSLRFAQDVKKVKNEAAVNEDLSGENVDALKAEIIRLKDQLRHQPEVNEEDIARLKDEISLWENKAKSWEEVAHEKDTELNQCKGQLSMRDFSIRIFHESSASQETKDAIKRWQAEFDEIVKDYRKEDLRSDLDVYQWKERALKAEEESQRLQQKVERLEEEIERYKRGNSQIRNQFDDVERRLSILTSPPGSPIAVTKLDRKSMARARRQRRMTRFTLTPIRSVQRPLVDVSPDDLSIRDDLFEPSEDVENQSVIEDLTDQLRSEQTANLKADIYANQLEQQLHDRDEIIRRYEREENEKLIAFSTRIESLEAEKSTLTTEVAHLRERIAKLQPENDQICSELIKIKERNDELVDERDKLLAKERGLNMELKHKIRAVYERDERIRELTIHLEASAACKDDLDRKNAELEEGKVDITLELDALRLEKQQIMNDAAKTQQALIECRKQLSDSKEQCKLLDEELKRSTAAIFDNAEAIQRKDNKIDELETQISRLSAERDEERKITERLIEEANKKVEKAEREFAALSEALMNVDMDIAPSKRRRSTFGDAIGRLNCIGDGIHVMKEQLETLAEERDKLVAYKETASQEIVKLKEENESLARDVDAVMRDPKTKHKINVLSRYRQRWSELEDEKHRLLEENATLRSMLLGASNASASTSCSAAKNNNNSSQCDKEVPCEKAATNRRRKDDEQKENAEPRQRRRRVAKTKN